MPVARGRERLSARCARRARACARAPRTMRGSPDLRARIRGRRPCSQTASWQVPLQSGDRRIASGDAVGPRRRRRDRRSRPDGALAGQRRLRRAHGGERRRSACSASTTRRPRSRSATSGCPGHDGLWLAHQIRHDAPETAVIMATGVQDVGSRGHQPAPGRHRLPDQAVRPRPPARVGHRAASSGTRRRATRAAGAKRSTGTSTAGAQRLTRRAERR